MSGKETLDIKASVFKTNQPIVETKIPPTSTSAEIISYLMYSQKMKIPDNYLVLLSFPIPNTNLRLYKIMESGMKISKYISHFKSFEIILYPPTLCVKIYSPDESFISVEFPSNLPTSKIIEKVCNESYHLEDSLCYSMYPPKKLLIDPIPQNKSIIEVDPCMENLYIIRRFWLESVNNLTRESDIHFNYIQAKKIVYDKHFLYKYFDVCDLIAIALMVEYKTKEAVKSVIKKSKGKGEAFFPKYVINDKSKKLKKKILSSLKNYKNKTQTELKKLFISTCMKNPFFGSLQFPVNCKIPGNETTSEHSLIFTEKKIYLTKPNTYDVEFEINLECVMKYKQISNEILRFTLNSKPKEKKIQVIELDINSKFNVQILEHFTSLANAIKKHRLEKEKKGKVVTHSHHVHSKLSKCTSISNLLMSRSPILNETSDLSSIMISTTAPIESEKIILNKIEAPKQQIVTEVDLSSMFALNEEINSDFIDTTNSNINSFITPEKHEYVLDSDMIQNGCNLIQRIITQESINPTYEVRTFIKNSLHKSKLIQKVIDNYIDNSYNSLIDCISYVSISLVLLFNEELSPLDGFATINYIRSIVLQFALQEWKDVDFLTQASSIDPMLSSLLLSYQFLMKDVNLPLSTILFEVFSAKYFESIPLLRLNESILLSLLCCSICIAKSFIDANIEVNVLKPIIDKLPKLITFDIILAYSLSTELKQITKKIQNDNSLRQKLLTLPHVSRIEISSIINCVDQLYNLTRFQISPISSLIKTFSPRFKVVPEFPKDLNEIINLYHISKDASFLLLAMNNTIYESLSNSLSFRASTFYNLFIEAFLDNNVNNNNDVLDAYKKFAEPLNEAIKIIAQNQNLFSFLNIKTDVVHYVIKLLLSSSEDTKIILSLLALESLSEKQRCNWIRNTENQIDQSIKNNDDKMNDNDKQKLSDCFRVFTIDILIQTKFHKNAVKIIEKLIETGKILLSILNGGLKSEERRQKSTQLRNLLKTILPVAYGEIDAVESFLQCDGKTTTIQSYKCNTIIKKPDVSISQDVLSKLAMTLQQFKRN